MRVSKPLLVLCAVASIALHVSAQNVIDVRTNNAPETPGNNQMLAVAASSFTRPSPNQSRDRETAGRDQTLTAYVTASITKPSPGLFNGGDRTWQENGTGCGRSAEYRTRIRGRNYGGLLFSDTPTNSTVYATIQPSFTWFIHRYEFDVLWTREFAPVLHRAVPYVTAGGGAIALNGGPTESGWNGHSTLVTGAGSDVHLSRLITMRAGFTLDSFKAQTYSDVTYHSTMTVMVEPRIGFVWNLGMPHPR